MLKQRIAIVMYDNYQGLDVVGPYETFKGAHDALALSGRQDGYDVVLVGDPEARSETGLSIGPIATPAGINEVDTLIIPGGRGVRAAIADDAAVTWVRDLATSARRTASVCTGAFLLAATGLAADVTLATHWAYADELATRFPELRVDGDSIYRNDGNIWSSAGVTAGIDLALALVADDHDAELAQLIARWLVVFPHRPGGQRQFAQPGSVPLAVHPGIADAQAHIAEHLTEDLRVEVVARAVGMSPRNFARLFRHHVGMTPGVFVQQSRLDAARDLLERSDMPLDAIVSTSGLGSTETLRRVMAHQIGVSPEAYRRRFGVGAPTPVTPTNVMPTAVNQEDLS